MDSRLFIIGFSLLLTGCSVYKASSNEGISVVDIQNCKRKFCLLSHGMQCLEKTETEGIITEVYKAMSRKSGVNYLRAAGHGVLDVITLGLWEVAGTPIEGAADNNRGYIIARTTRNSDSDVFNSIEIFDEEGKLAVKCKFKVVKKS